MNHRKKIAGMLAALLLFTSSVAAGENLPTPTQPVYTLDTAAPVQSLYPGDVVYLTLDCSEAMALYGLEAEIVYDAEYLTFSKLQHPFGEQEIIERLSEPEAGKVCYVCTRKGQAAQAPVKERVLTVELIAKKSGKAEMGFAAVKAVQEDMTHQTFALEKDVVSVTIQDKAAPTPTPTRRPSGGGSSGSFGGGGGGGGSISVSGGNSITAKPPVPTQIPEPTAPSALDPTFEDLEAVPWAEEAIGALYEKGILKGREAGKFMPLETISRAELAKILVETFCFERTDKEVGFSDVTEDAWYYENVITAAQHGIILGEDNGCFAPERGVTREEFATMLARTIAVKQLKLEAVRLNINFIDEKDIADFAVGYVDQLYTFGVIDGDDTGAFRPRDSLNRAEGAVGVYKLLQRLAPTAESEGQAE